MKLSELKERIEAQLAREWAKSMDAEERGLDTVVAERMEHMTVLELLEMLSYMDD